MPKLTEEAIDSLIDSLNKYDEQMVRDAIELARDPEVAGQLVNRLRKTITDDEDFEWEDRLSTAGVALVLGEAGATGVIAVLLDRVVNATGMQFTDEVFEYVLRRIGEPMVREAMARIPEMTKPLGRSKLYGLIDSAHTLSPGFQREIADFCVTRMPIELELPADRNGKTGWYSCCRVLITLGDDRAGRIIDKGINDITRRKRRESWERLGKSLRDYFGEPMDVREECDHRIDWPRQIPRWAAVYTLADEEFGDPELDEMLQRVDSLMTHRPSVLIQPETALAHAEDGTLSTEPKISRNGPCPCGSGKKYKKCCGAASTPPA